MRSATSRWLKHGEARASREAGSHEEGKFGAAVLYATHEPELTDFYTGLGFPLSPDGIGIPTPTEASR